MALQRSEYASDGWYDPQLHPILNFIAMTYGVPMFLKAINTEGEVKLISQLFLPSLLLVCVVRCSLFVGDNF
jgi:hypothetical protein